MKTNKQINWKTKITLCNYSATNRINKYRIHDILEKNLIKNCDNKDLLSYRQTRCHSSICY